MCTLPDTALIMLTADSIPTWRRHETVWAHDRVWGTPRLQITVKVAARDDVVERRWRGGGHLVKPRIRKTQNGLTSVQSYVIQQGQHTRHDGTRSTGTIHDVRLPSCQ